MTRYEINRRLLRQPKHDTEVTKDEEPPPPMVELNMSEKLHKTKQEIVILNSS